VRDASAKQAPASGKIDTVAIIELRNPSA